MLGLYRDNGKEHGNYSNRLYRFRVYSCLAQICWLLVEGINANEDGNDYLGSLGFQKEAKGLG